MIPIQELISRIRWDEDFARGKFEIGYFDRVENSIIRIPFGEMQFEKDSHFSFLFVDNRAVPHRVPFHRIKEVYKDGELIWRRVH